MATIKRPIKKAQTGTVAKDKTSVTKTRDVSKDLKYNTAVKKTKEDIKKVTRPYTAMATPDPEAMFPGDSIRYYPGKRGGIGTPYIRDVGGKPGLLGIDTNTTDAGFAKASRDKKKFRTYQDTTAVKANFEKNKNGGKVIKKKMKNGGSLSGLKASNKRVGPVDPNGAFTKVQERTLAGAKGKAKLVKDKQLGATKMAKRGMSIKKK
jgi:hypothetical protein